jgi:hypothetical protein
VKGGEYRSLFTNQIQFWLTNQENPLI